MTTYPTIHINGTSKQELLDSYIQAANAIDDAIKTIGKIEFNGRDYYPQGSLAFERAREERRALMISLLNAKEHFIDIAIHIQKQGK